MSEDITQNAAPEAFDLREMFELVRQVPVASSLYQRSRELLEGKLEIEPDFPQATGPREKKFLTIGMATANDYDGFYFTVQSIRMYHPEILNDVEFLVIDNASDGPCSQAMKDLENWEHDNFRYVPYRTHQSTAVRDLLFREATGDFVLSIDSHVMFEAGSLAKLIAYCRANPESIDLLHGPLLSDSLGPDGMMGTRFDPIWSCGMFGQWGKDERGMRADEEEFEIGMQGLGVFGCRKAIWPGLNPRLAGFGGEEGYVHEKIRRAGGRNLCLPFLRWLHRFNRPLGGKYPNRWEDRIRNYMIIHEELGIDSADMIAHFKEHIGEEPTEGAVEIARAELASPFHAFDAVFCINRDDQPERWEAMRERFMELGIERKVRRYSAADTPLDPHIGNVLSHRRIIAEARLQQLQKIVVFDDDNEFPPDAAAEMALSLEELQGSEWQLSFLDGPGIAYHHSIYGAILTVVPNDPFKVARMVRGFEEGSMGSMQQLLPLLGVQTPDDQDEMRPDALAALQALEVYEVA